MNQGISVQGQAGTNFNNRVSSVQPIAVKLDEPSLLSQLTPRGRRVMASLALLPIVLVFSLTGSHKAVASDTTSKTRVITITQGQSLWDVAQLVDPATDPRSTIWTIQQLNHMDTSDLSNGQSLIVPAN